MHNGHAIELLHHVGNSEHGQVWRVKPLFVDEPERDTTIRPGDSCTRLHTGRC